MFWIPLLIVAAGTTILLVCFWDTLSSAIEDFLHHNDLAETWLMDAWIEVDRLARGVRVKLFAKGRTKRKQLVTNTTYPDEHELPDEVRERIQNRKRAKMNVMEYVA